MLRISIDGLSSKPALRRPLMCGIAGSIGSPDGADALVKQLATLAHRGPDASGTFTRGAGAIGQTRLAVIDLVTGDPPIMTDDGQSGVVLNGEIYNYRDLRAELLQAGHRFTTSGDTEVIVHLAETLAPVALARRLDGMFAFAVWDARKQRLVLGRDRLGKKPLYYWESHGRLVFGSEIKAVLAHPDVSRDLDASAIDAYLTYGYVPTPKTFFSGVRSVPPGHVLVAEPGRPAVLERYWAPPLAVDGQRLDIGFDEAAREVRRTLCDAVERRLVADVPLGAFLSGGIDSSAVVAFMARLSTQPVKTFTIGFEDDDGFDERPFARTIAERFGTEHTEFVVHPERSELIETTGVAPRSAVR